MLNDCKKHLKDVGEGYFQHMFNAAAYGMPLIGAGLAALVHAVFPALFQRTASDTVASLHGILQARLAKIDCRQNNANTEEPIRGQAEHSTESL